MFSYTKFESNACVAKITNHIHLNITCIILYSRITSLVVSKIDIPAFQIKLGNTVNRSKQND